MHEHELSDQAGYELFRRAVVERDDEAWAAIHTHFRPLLVGWARQAGMRAPSACQYEDIADRALARAWLALSADQFAQFPSLAALLAYLRVCVGAATIDDARAEATRERAYQRFEAPPVATPEELVLEAISRAELWRLVDNVVCGEHERIVLIESFVLGLPPRVILERHQDRFADVPEIYGIKRNLLNRLDRLGIKKHTGPGTHESALTEFHRAARSFIKCGLLQQIRRELMSTVDLTQGRWRLHHMIPQVMSPAAMPAPGPNGTNTDVLLRFEVIDLQLSAAPPNPTPLAVQGTWYKGTIEANDPRHDAWDNPQLLGTFWAQVFPATNLTRHCVQIIQEDFPAPGETNTTGEKLVRIYMGRYFANEVRFFGYGADNWASELFTFTLTHEEWPG